VVQWTKQAVMTFKCRENAHQRRGPKGAISKNAVLEGRYLVQAELNRASRPTEPCPASVYTQWPRLALGRSNASPLARWVVTPASGLQGERPRPSGVRWT